jgi:hypothetical protein
MDRSIAALERRQDMTIPRWRLALASGALVVLGALGGGLVQAAATPSAPAAGADPTAAAAEDALLLDSLVLASDPTSNGAALPVQRLAVRERLAGRLANLRSHLVHGTLTVLDRDENLVTYQLDHGTVSAIDGASITIAETGGTSVTVFTTAETRVRGDARPSTLDNLKAGDEVVVRSTVDGGSATAKLIVVPPASPGISAAPDGSDG